MYQGSLLYALLFQELKQDISSFRYEVMGMMKTGKSSLQGAKASGSSVESSLAYPNSSLKVSPCPKSSQVKSKLNRFKITTSIIKQGSTAVSPRPPEASNGLPNGLWAHVSDECSTEKSSQRRNFPKDISDFGLFQKRHWSGNETTSGAGEASRKMYSLSEVVGESEGSDTEEQHKDHMAGGEIKEELLKGEKAEDTAVNEPVNENDEVLNTNSSLEEAGQKETKVKDKDSLPCSDPVADECLSGSCRVEA